MTVRFTGDHLLVATHNQGKLDELNTLLQGRGITLVSALEAAIEEPDETGTTFEANAILKAEAGFAATRLPCLADDSGLAVDALGGEPGVYTARWAGPQRDFDMAMKTVHDKVGDSPRTAHFVSVIALTTAQGTITTRGECHGTLTWPTRGTGGFGYDPMFIPDGETRTFAEMTLTEKKAYSHRAKALAAMMALGFS